MIKNIDNIKEDYTLNNIHNYKKILTVKRKTKTILGKVKNKLFINIQK